MIPSIKSIDDFEMARHTEPVFVVIFCAKWCHTCKHVIETVERLYFSCQIPLCVNQVDIDDCNEVFQSCWVGKVPSVKIFCHRMLMRNITGFNGFKDFEDDFTEGIEDCVRRIKYLKEHAPHELN